MNAGQMLFVQLMGFLPWSAITRYVKSLTRTEHYGIIAFAQLTSQESPRDIEACLAVQANKLYHIFRNHWHKKDGQVKGLPID